MKINLKKTNMINIKILSFTVFTLVVIFLSACSQSNDDRLPSVISSDNSSDMENASYKNSSEWKIVTHKDFAMYMPASWKEVEIINNTILKYYPYGADNSDINAERVTILISPLNSSKEKITIKELIDNLISTGTETYPDFKLLAGPANTTIGTSPGWNINYTLTIDGQKMQSTEIIGLNGNNTFIISYACRINTCKNYELFNLMVKSIIPN